MENIEGNTFQGTPMLGKFGASQGCARASCEELKLSLNTPRTIYSLWYKHLHKRRTTEKN